MIRPVVVKAYIVPALRHDLSSAKGLNKSGYRVLRDEDEVESGAYAVINKQIALPNNLHLCVDTLVFFYLKIGQMYSHQFEKQ